MYMVMKEIKHDLLKQKIVEVNRTFCTENGENYPLSFLILIS